MRIHCLSIYIAFSTRFYSRNFAIFRISIRRDERLKPSEQDVCSSGRARRTLAGGCAFKTPLSSASSHSPGSVQIFANRNTNARRICTVYCPNVIIYLRKYYSYLCTGVVTFRPRAVLQYRFTIFES